MALTRAPLRSPAWVWLICGILFLANFVNYGNRVTVTQNSVEIIQTFETNREGYGKTEQMKDWLAMAFTRAVVKRALACMIVVGAVLILINHGDAIFHGDLSRGRIAQIGLTFLVPYCVSTFSSVAAMRAAEREKSKSKRT